MTDSEQVREKTKHRLDKCDMMPAHILHGEVSFFNEAACRPFSASLFPYFQSKID